MMAFDLMQGFFAMLADRPVLVKVVSAFVAFILVNEVIPLTTGWQLGTAAAVKSQNNLF